VKKEIIEQDAGSGSPTQTPTSAPGIESAAESAPNQGTAYVPAEPVKIKATPKQIGKRAQSERVPNITLQRTGSLHGATYGDCSYKLYEAHDSPAQGEEPPLLVIWLHGGDMGDIPQACLARMHSHLGRRVCFLVPLSPKNSPTGLKFEWGVSHAKSQNKHELSFIYGELHEPFLKDFCNLVRSVTLELGALHVCVIGYSMGGFGAYQLAGHDPDVFDVVFSTAGYGLGTLEPEDRGYGAPQPQSSNIFLLLWTSMPGTWRRCQHYSLCMHAMMLCPRSWMLKLYSIEFRTRADVCNCCVFQMKVLIQILGKRKNWGTGTSTFRY